MKKHAIAIGILVALGFAVFGCTEKSEGQGSAVVGVKGSALSLDDIDHITVTVSGSDFSPDIVQNLTGDPVSGWSGTIENIPVGDDRTFLAQAFDASDVVLYSGSATGVTIVDGETVQVVVYLQQVDPPDPFENGVPRFQSVVLSSSQVGPTNDVAITATAVDPDGDPLVYAWSATGGGFSDDTTPGTTWTAPTEVGLYELTVSATDPDSASATISFSIDVQIHYGAGNAEVLVDINSWPEMQGLVPDPTRIEVGETTQLDLTALDPDGDPLTYSWSADCTGTFSDTAIEDPSFTLDADNGDADCTLTVDISDGRGGQNVGSIAIQTGSEAEVDIDDDLGYCIANLGMPEYNGSWDTDSGARFTISNDGGCWEITVGTLENAMFVATNEGTVAITNNTVPEISGQAITYTQFALSCISNCGSFTGVLNTTRYIDTAAFSPRTVKYGRLNTDSFAQQETDILAAIDMSYLDPSTKQPEVPAGCVSNLGMPEYNGFWESDGGTVFEISNDGGCWVYTAGLVFINTVFVATNEGTVSISNDYISEISGQTITYTQFALSCINNCGNFTSVLNTTRYVDSTNFAPSTVKYGRFNTDSFAQQVIDIQNGSYMSHLDPFTKFRVSP